MRFCVVRVELHIEESWGVGTIAITGEAGLPILKDPRDCTPVVPASSLVGSLRRHLNSTLGEEETVALLGPHVDAATAKSSGREIRALGTTLLGKATDVERSATRINPVTRAADIGALFTESLVLASLAKPTTLSWFLEYPGASNPDLLDAISSWRPIIGRRRTTGRGSAKVTHLEEIAVDLDLDADLQWWLTKRHDWFQGRDHGRAGTVTRLDGTAGPSSTPLFALDFEVMDAIHVGTGEKSGSSETRESKPALTLKDSDGNPIVAGTSWKGIFRARCQYIANIVAGSDGREDWGPRITKLFGEAGNDQLAEQGGTRGCLRFKDSEFHGVKCHKRTHAAIDRFSGGVKSGATFSEEVIPLGARSKLVVETDGVLDATDEKLLRWVLQDLQDALIGVGGKTARGYGTIRFDEPPAAAPFGSEHESPADRSSEHGGQER